VSETKLKSHIHSGSWELLHAMNIPAEKEILEDLAVQVLRLITGKSLNTRQVLVLLELVQAEVKECALV